MLTPETYPSARLDLRRLTRPEAQAIIDGGRDVPCAWAEDYPVLRDAFHAARRVIDETDEWAIGTYLIIGRQSSLVVGELAVMTAPGSATIDIAYSVAPSVRNRGFATEAVLAILDVVTTNHAQIDEVRAFVLPTNVSSLRVLAKAGFTSSGQQRGIGVEWIRTLR